MKKTLVSALTTALVVGAASTTFAAANPFSDVPADHWAYDAVAQLAADGVIDGYGDGTYKGDRNITRYEMAQMVAKAMAKSTSGADKALVDKLAAEFADELNNLGVRVAKLERNADMVKWNGKAEYTISRYNAGKAGDERTNNLTFRLEPSAEVNNHWHVNARLDANVNLAKDEVEDEGSVKLKRAWAQGDYTNFTVKLGKFSSYDDDSIFDTTHTGVEVSFGKEVKGTIGYARLDSDKFTKWATAPAYGAPANYADTTADHLYAGVDYAKDKLSLGASYHNIKVKDIETPARFSDSNGIWMLKAGYQFTPNVNVKGFYAQGKEDFVGSLEKQKKAGGIEVNYKGAQAENKGSWGAWVAYRHLGKNAVPFGTWDVTRVGEKDFEIGANYTVFKNVILTGRYGFGKDLATDERTSNAFGRVEFLF
ncbi:S-layer homology domain-containing protein [Selenomonas ruminantium]|uniref:S-layer homology domain-containing protein n=1 Tax=Selenomonas ruminantium TaxID=971 RepID=A0A1I3EJ77_SELRU|nr:S-layer homology domain-containing protein [Selenomonas ruminantium]SFH98997.1 S-layer homology domain-containing protein [Selenomonas ruminantium]